MPWVCQDLQVRPRSKYDILDKQNWAFCIENGCRGSLSINKFGFCKFAINCFRKHENQKCDNELCEIRKCPLRHPKNCRYFAEFNKCKFGSFCKFNHDGIKNLKFDQEIELLKKELDYIKNGMKEREMEIKEKDEEIKKVSKKWNVE